MKNNDYRRYIIDMINHIHSNTALKEIYSFVAGYAKRVPAIGITPALSLLYGHCPAVLLYILHHFNGFGASQGSSCGSGGHG